MWGLGPQITIKTDVGGRLCDVFFCLCDCLVERSKAFLIVSQVVVSGDKDEECVVNTVYMLFVGRDKPTSRSGGRAHAWTLQECDYTMGKTGPNNLIAVAFCSLQ